MISVMANFKTHIQFGTLTTGAFASALTKLDLVDIKEGLICWGLGCLGSILPDIDSDNSHSLSILFGLLSGGITLIVFLITIDTLPLVQLWLICILSYWLITHPSRKVFEYFTRHRGIFHSLMAGLFFGALTLGAAALFAPLQTAWLFGFSVCLGYILHLILDEIYSVDFMNRQIKRSFGTAIKPISKKNWLGTLAMTGIIIGIFYQNPFPTTWAHSIYTQISQNTLSEILINPLSNPTKNLL